MNKKIIIFVISLIFLTNLSFADNCPQVQKLKREGSTLVAEDTGNRHLVYINSDGWIDLDKLTNIQFIGANIHQIKDSEIKDSKYKGELSCSYSQQQNKFTMNSKGSNVKQGSGNWTQRDPRLALCANSDVTGCNYVKN